MNPRFGLALLLALVTLLATTSSALAQDFPSAPKLDPVHSKAQAIAIAREETNLQNKHVEARFERCCWEVDFHGRDGEIQTRVDIRDSTGRVIGVWEGHQIKWKMARGVRAAFGGAAMGTIVWPLLFAVFALLTIDFRRPRSQANVDVLALLSFGVSHEFFQRGMIEWSVPLAIPPLLWLAFSGLLRIHRSKSPERNPSGGSRKTFADLVPLKVLVILCVLLAGFRLGATIDSGSIIDVGQAGVYGAELMLDGEGPWDNMPSDNPRGDTYGPLNYIVYILAEALFTSNHDAAQWSAIIADFSCVLLLFFYGWRTRSTRLGLLLSAAWLSCPWTFLALGSASNDALLAAFILALILALSSPLTRGALLAAASMIKFAPLALVPLVLRIGRADPRQQIAKTLLAGSVTLLAFLLLVVKLIDQPWRAALKLFWERTLGFQAGRDSPFSVWGLYELDRSLLIAQLLVVALLVYLLFRPYPRYPLPVVAGISSLLAATQLVTTHWFYLYIPWLVGPLLITVFLSRPRNTDMLQE